MISKRGSELWWSIKSSGSDIPVRWSSSDFLLNVPNYLAVNSTAGFITAAILASSLKASCLNFSHLRIVYLKRWCLTESQPARGYATSHHCLHVWAWQPPFCPFVKCCSTNGNHSFPRWHVSILGTRAAFVSPARIGFPGVAAACV